MSSTVDKHITAAKEPMTPRRSEAPGFQSPAGSDISLELDTPTAGGTNGLVHLMENRPSGLVAIRFFSPSAPTSAAPGKREMKVLTPRKARAQSADSAIVPPAQQPVMKRGRGRPRTRSIDGQPIQRPLRPTVPIAPISLEDLKLPKIAPRPAGLPPQLPATVIMVPPFPQPNSILQAVRGGAMLPRLDHGGALLGKRRVSPEVDVLRLISDACDIREGITKPPRKAAGPPGKRKPRAPRAPPPTPEAQPALRVPQETLDLLRQRKLMPRPLPGGAIMGKVMMVRPKKQQGRQQAKGGAGPKKDGRRKEQKKTDVVAGEKAHAATASPASGPPAA